VIRAVAANGRLPSLRERSGKQPRKPHQGAANLLVPAVPDPESRHTRSGVPRSDAEEDNGVEAWESGADAPLSASRVTPCLSL